MQRAAHADARPHADDYASTTAANCHQTSSHTDCATYLNADSGFANFGSTQRDPDAHARRRCRDNETDDGTTCPPARESQREHRISRERWRYRSNVRR